MKSKCDPSKVSPQCPSCGADLAIYGGIMGDVTAQCTADDCDYEWDSVWDGELR